MADIALLVAEEFEKRKNGAKEIGEFNSWVVNKASDVGRKVREEMVLMKEIAINELEKPKSAFSLAAFDGFFSA